MSVAAVREVQLASLPTELHDLDPYPEAFVVFRQDEAVVGQAWLPVRDGRLDAESLDQAARRCAWPAWLSKIEEAEFQSGGPTDLSVVVCTRDRPEDLARCLDGLLAMDPPVSDILVVDNAPSDERTRALVDRTPGVRYVRELRPGAAAARNRGIRETRTELVAFTDDDAVPDSRWLTRVSRCFADPLVAVVTGATMPLELETPAQVWFEKAHGFCRGYERREFDRHQLTPLAAGLAGASVNMVIRRSALDEIGVFDEALGPGTLTRCGEDHEFFYRVLARGLRIVYEPRALVWHRHRSDEQALSDVSAAYGSGVFAWWTRALLEERDFGVLKIGLAYLWSGPGRAFLRSVIGHPGSPPLRVAAAELFGAFAGPLLYLRSRRHLKRQTAIGKRSSGGEAPPC